MWYVQGETEAETVNGGHARCLLATVARQKNQRWDLFWDCDYDEVFAFGFAFAVLELGGPEIRFLRIFLKFTDKFVSSCVGFLIEQGAFVSSFAAMDGVKKWDMLPKAANDYCACVDAAAEVPLILRIRPTAP